MNKKIAKKKDVKETDKHISTRLEEHFDITDVSVMQGLLEDYRSDEPNVTIGKQLESKHTNNKEAVTEKLLNDTKGSFGNKIRNSDAYQGDINVLDKERLAKKQEVEKAELASKAPKDMRWWEAESEDGLKIAKAQHPQKKTSKTAQVDSYGLGNIDDYPDDDFDDGFGHGFNTFDSLEDEDPLEDDLFGEEDVEEDSNVYLINQSGDEYVFGIIDEEVPKEKTMEDVFSRMVEIKPELEYELSRENPGEFSVNERTGEMVIKVNATSSLGDFEIDDLGSEISFTKDVLTKADLGGTEMIMGSFSFSGFAEDTDKFEIALAASEYLEDEYSINVNPEDIRVNESSLEFEIPANNKETTESFASVKKK